MPHLDLGITGLEENSEGEGCCQILVSLGAYPEQV